MTPPAPWLEKLKGQFMVFDGPDGSGKSTQHRRFRDWVQTQGIEVCEVREPGGTHIGEQVRKILLDPSNKEQVDVRCEMLLFMASRAQLVAQRIEPALKRGCLVLADRFISSTLAYQGTAGGLPVQDIMDIGRIALSTHWPDLVVIFDVDEYTASARRNPLLRKTEFAQGQDRIENKGAIFHQRVRQGYLAQATADPARHRVIDASGEPDAVFATLLKVLETWAMQR